MLVGVITLAVSVVTLISCKVWLRRKEAKARRKRDILASLRQEGIDVAGCVLFPRTHVFLLR